MQHNSKEIGMSELERDEVWEEGYDVGWDEGWKAGVLFGMFMMGVMCAIVVGVSG